MQHVLDTSSGEAVAALDGGNNSGGEEKGRDQNGGDELGEKNNNNFGGNRWPRQETLALLKIRSDMDAVFRDSSLKGPLWEQVSRKLAELGYHRNAKKCKEKFENVYKYHKRTKESRSAKSEGKTYKFFDQLQALENHQFTVSSYPPKPQPTATLSTPTNTITTLPTTRPPSDTTTSFSYLTTTTTVPSTNPTLMISPSASPPPVPPPPTTVSTNNNHNNNNVVPYSLPNINNLFSSSTSTSSSTASDENLEEKYRKKRKWKEYFRRLTRQVLAKQEEMQKKFLEAIDKREREQVAQQDAWRMQEMARINREHEILVQERSTAAAKDAAVIAFLQKLSGQPNPTTQPQPQLQQQQSQHKQQQQQQQTQQQIIPQPQQQQIPQSQQQQQQQTQQQIILHPQQQQQQQIQQREQQIQQQIIPQPPLMSNNNSEIQKFNDGNNAASLSSSSRWPKAEVHALIRLRTSLETKYLENGPKAPLWEDISAGMQRLGYNRSAKRCKEKWENINKYFKKVKESKRQRREDSKTCPYFHELDALYKEKSKSTQNSLFGPSFQDMKSNEMMEPLMVQPEQQWRPPQYEESVAKENNGAGQFQAKQRDGEEDDDDSDDDGVDEDEESVEDIEEGV